MPILRNEMLFFPDKPFCDGLRPASSGQVVNYRCSLPRIELLCRSILASYQAMQSEMPDPPQSSSLRVA